MFWHKLQYYNSRVKFAFFWNSNLHLKKDISHPLPRFLHKLSNYLKKGTSTSRASLKIVKDDVQSKLKAVRAMHCHQKRPQQVAIPGALNRQHSKSCNGWDEYHLYFYHTFVAKRSNVTPWYWSLSFIKNQISQLKRFYYTSQGFWLHLQKLWHGNFNSIIKLHCGD